MCDTNDGFRIAEADLKLRGPGDLEGTQQSGMAFDLKIANIAEMVSWYNWHAQKHRKSSTTIPNAMLLTTPCCGTAS